MGFAASQARFLSLTARLSDNEYEAQQISQQRLAITDDLDDLADIWSEALNNQIYMATIYDEADNGATKEVVLSYDTITKPEFGGGLGMTIITPTGRVVVSSEEEIPGKLEELNQDRPEGEKLTMADFYVFEQAKDIATLQNNLEQGNFLLAPKYNTETKDWDAKSMSALSTISKIYDKTDDAAANADYTRESKRLERQDAMLEMRLEQLEADHKAIETEMDSVQKVIDDNVENSFKTFG